FRLPQTEEILKGYHETVKEQVEQKQIVQKKYTKLLDLEAKQRIVYQNLMLQKESQEKMLAVLHEQRHLMRLVHLILKPSFFYKVNQPI
ncbi:hypothetical protein P4S91_04650, partial [Aneurinibacillus aneurinilyticus]|nr:hypothetical protein [Aneurinibacillus aneurinilyticus]MED0730447.1 hypothetical protein [Aneurinibacillus aneurinilyticus]